MDRALQREREAFKRRALATPTVENKQRKVTEATSRSSSSSSSSINNNNNNNNNNSSSGTKMKAPELNYKSFTSNNSSQYKFGVLARVVRHMRTRHQEGEVHALTLQEILDETNQLNVGPKIKQWLQAEALPNNPKVVDGGNNAWVFNPALPVRDRKGLLKMLRINEIKGCGGILMEDIQESVPQHAKVMKILANDVLIVTRQDKKQVVFYLDHSMEYTVDTEFQQLWRNTSVDGMHDDNIDEYLTKQGIKSMQDVTRVFRPARRKKARRNLPTKITDNDHLAYLLKDYETN